MPGPILHLGATVTCSHGGQAQPTAPNPRVLVSGQPVVTQADAVRDRRLRLRAAGRQRPVRHRQLRHRRDAGLRRRRAGGADGQRRHLRPDRQRR